MRFSEFKIVESVIKSKVITEAARIQHAEDLIFWEGSRGAVRALEGLKNLEGGGHQDVTVKWDGSPAIIFGRDDDGNFILTDKSGFTAKGYDGKAKSAEDLEAMLMNRPGAQRDPESYGKFASNMKDIFDEYEKALSKDFRGFLKGDLLYFNTPELVDGRFVFKPNIVEYSVDKNSDIGQKIAQSKTGIVIHRLVDENGVERPLAGDEIETLLEGNEVLVLPPVVAQEPPTIDDTSIQELRRMISQGAQAVDNLLDTAALTERKMKDLPNIFYTYLNSKVDSGLENLANDFASWLASSKVSPTKQKKVVEWIAENKRGFDFMWRIVESIMRVKDDIIQQLDNQSSAIEQSINGEKGGEGYVLAHPQGDIKLVPREFFSRANRAVER